MSKMAERVCGNCLGPTPVITMNVGYMKGNQLDPMYDTEDFNLCRLCQDALEKRDYVALHDRFKTERTIQR